MRDIPGYEGLYAITSCGKVWSYKSQKWLKTYLDKDGYCCISIWVKNIRKNYRIHRLVAETYLLNPNNFPVVNHKDENKQNNSLNNLEWCSINYNNNYGTRKKLYSSMNKGIICLENNKIYNSIQEAAKEYNLCPQYIGQLAKKEKKFKFI